MDEDTRNPVSVEQPTPDTEGQSEKLKYPKSVFFIVGNEFCERFCYYGMRTILVIYLTNILLYSEGTAKIIYHTFNMLGYFFPVVGAILSDSLLGKFNTILYVSIIYASGSILLSLASAEPVGLPQGEFSMLGLLLIALGTGGIKPCVSAFGGDQFVLPQQESQLDKFFSLFYFSINAGSLISTFLTPILRSDLHCFGEDSCFPVAFAVPGGLMICSIIIFAVGKPLYKIRRPEGNVIVRVVKCIVYAIRQKMKSNKKKDHWLYYAEDKFGTKLIKDIKVTLKVLVLYTPLPIFWALYDQQGSGWTFQAIKMNGDIGFYTILPEQMQVVNPVLILLFIPIFTYYVYPLLGKCHLLVTPLQRMVCGGVLAAVAFAVSALVSLALEGADPVLPTGGNIQLRIYNPTPFPMHLESELIDLPHLKPFELYVNKDISFKNTKNITFEVSFNKTDGTYQEFSGTFTFSEKNAYGIVVNDNISYFEDMVGKSDTGYPLIRTLTYNVDDVEYTKVSRSLTVHSGDYSLQEIDDPGVYTVNGKKKVTFRLGGTYTVMVMKNDSLQIKEFVVTEPNNIHMLWMLPQIIIITAAEIMFSITGLEFSYSQAPSSMKSLLQACFLLTTAFGNAIIVIIESAKIFDKQSSDFFLYTGLMLVDMLLFGYMAYRYKYITPEDDEGNELNGGEGSERSNGVDNPSFNDPPKELVAETL